MVDHVDLRSLFARRVAEQLALAHLSTEDLAALTSLPAQRIDKILKGRLVRMTIKDMDKIANALGTSTYYLIAPLKSRTDLAQQ